ncbi:MAG: ATP synthase F0 subunit C [Bdellovibrionota bacterium]|nr:hypothetical protein [Pseudobdellovibrionaceae bacterium]MEC9281423.1 ATP synthase F0 subunit C [Bdellovibrionota bacterium]|tara:strand:+ start:47397 stop:47705 length:309 start_codon:yes stop_codon:yes gene_type:complete
MKKALLVFVATFASVSAFAQEAAITTDVGTVAFSAALAIAIAALGGTLGQAMAIRSGLDGIARNPAAQGKVFIPMLLGLALIESLVLFAFLIANTLAGAIVG